MTRTKTDKPNGLYPLFHDLTRLESIVAEMNRRLTGKDLIAVRDDTAEPHNLLQIGYARLSGAVKVSERSVSRYEIYIGGIFGGITLRDQPLVWAGTQYHASVDFNGDFIRILSPYFFYSDESRVDYQKYAFRPI